MRNIDVEGIREKVLDYLEDVIKQRVAEAGGEADTDWDGVDSSDSGGGEDQPPAPAPAEGICIPKSLPKSLAAKAVQTAIEVNPANALFFNPMPPGSAEDMRPVMPVQMISALMPKYWGKSHRTLSVSFMESAPNDLKNRIVSHFNAWQCGVTFALTGGVGQIRISRGQGGYWSYLGTDCLQIPQNRQTMNLAGFTMNTSEAEFRRVVRHECGHTLAYPHEHMRRELIELLDREKTYAYFKRTQGWDRVTVDQQVLTSLDERSLMKTPPDQDSLMCYQLPGSITKNGQPIKGGGDINATDLAFAQEIYPPIIAPPPPPEGKVRIFVEYDLATGTVTARVGEV